MNDINDPNNPPKHHSEVPLDFNHMPAEGFSYSAANAIPPEFQNDYGIKYDTRTNTCEELIFTEVIAETQKAILLALTDNDGEIIEKWLPKKLCSNMDVNNCAINIWDVFAKENLQDFI